MVVASKLAADDKALGAARESNARLRRCFACNGSRWFSEFPWLATRDHKNVFSVGCFVCSEAGALNMFAGFQIILRSDFHPYLLKRHGDSAEHAKSVAIQPDGGPAGSFGAPTAEQFKKVARNPTGTFDDLGAKKQRAMIWCMSECKRDRERKLVRNAASTLYSQDASDGKLLSRVSVSTGSFVNARFIIGWAPLMGTDSFAILETSKHSAELWATPRSNKPVYGGFDLPRKPCVDELAVTSLWESVQAVVTDAASDEFRCMRLASGSSGSAFVCDTLMPNLVIHGKDPTHATGRFLKARR